MDAQSLYELAMKHIYGDGVPEDNDLAAKLLNKAHDMGHVEATYNLGIYVEQDRKQAEYWFRKAMESSDSDAVEEAQKELTRNG